MNNNNNNKKDRMLLANESSNSILFRRRKPGPESLSSKLTEEPDDEYWYQVLNLCGQDNPSHFGIEFSSTSYHSFEYLDSGTYSHVIKANGIDFNNIAIVFKVIIKFKKKIKLNFGFF